jgi:hypothetical protein
MRHSMRQVQVILVLVCSTLLVSNVGAQSLVPTIAPTIGLGVALPYGPLRKTAGTGLTVNGGADLKFASFPVLLRPELNYVRFTDRTGRDDHRISASLNLVVPVRRGRISPYAILGAGIYHFARSLRDTYHGLSAIAIGIGGPAENDASIDAGGGVDFSFGSVRGRLDARYRHVQVQPFNIRPDTYFPVTLSFRF